MITIVGGGLAGCEAAWQAASRGVPVTLHEMRPARPTAESSTPRTKRLVRARSATVGAVVMVAAAVVGSRR